MSTNVGTRYSLAWLQDQYDNHNNKQPLEDLVRAWHGIQNLPPTDPNSFFVLAGYHGEPFILREAVEALPEDDKYAYWGGYCAHGNVLFPLWHRAYLWRLEKALQSIVPGVTLPFWDQTDPYNQGIPRILTDAMFDHPTLGRIKNPLCSFTLPASLSDDYWADNKPAIDDTSPYYKPAGYQTMRYPYSGLVGNEADKESSAKHNQKYEDYQAAVSLLNQNVKDWINVAPQTPDGKGSGPGIRLQYMDCLDAPNYTVFSNTTSASAWNLTVPGQAVVALESPHNDVHLAAGGFDAPQIYAALRAGRVPGANGDMGENNTAAFDPMFFFHHCNVDRMFWVWQKLHESTNDLEIIPNYPGTSSSDSQGPTPGVAPGTPLSLDTPLNPFGKTGKDCINIEEQLGYTYGKGSLDGGGLQKSALAAKKGFSAKKLVVRGIDRAQFQGSFLVTVTASVPDASGEPRESLVGYHSVFSRWDVLSCANCRTHLEVVAHFPLREMSEDEVGRAAFNVAVHHRDEARPGSIKTRSTLSRDLKVTYEITD
ncbi:tyrosinase family protein [Sorangium sp. So ce513]|uniref:tyrosinase family protein n=1 Tax=Sorangium sp. So ce513 TaxID=3133315 RepID=UPI003F5DED76